MLILGAKNNHTYQGLGGPGKEYINKQFFFLFFFYYIFFKNPYEQLQTQC
jgi:hypothetical protein